MGGTKVIRAFQNTLEYDINTSYLRNKLTREKFMHKKRIQIIPSMC